MRIKYSIRVLSVGARRGRECTIVHGADKQGQDEGWAGSSTAATATAAGKTYSQGTGNARVRSAGPRTSSIVVASVVLSVVAAAAAATIPTVPVVQAAEAAPNRVAYYPELGIGVETVASGLSIPWSVDWLPDGSMLFTERGGAVKMIGNGSTQPETLLEVDVGAGNQEGGLLGIAVDPDFDENGYVYVYHTYDSAFFALSNKIVRYQYDDSGNGGGGAGRLANEHVILDGIPGSPWHDGGRIQFGPDGMLYATTGDAIEPGLSQRLDSLAGKILRMDRNGMPPGDNPWDGLLAYSIGHRNPQGIDWNADGMLVATEHGPSGGLMGTGNDEVNAIMPGRNYGWPEVVGSSGAGGDNAARDSPYEDPLFHTGRSVTWAPSGSEFYEADAIPEWQGRDFVATLFGRGLQMMTLDVSSGDATHDATLFANEFGRLRDVQTGPDGYLYVLTSNRDGRGSPAPEDDRILRIVPLYGDVGGIRDSASDSDIRGDPGMQALKTLLYEGEGTEQTGPLTVSLRHPGYDASQIAFDTEQKLLEFEFERAGALHTPTGSSLSLYLEKPIASPPFDVMIYDHDKNRMPGSSHTVRDGGDHYVITIDAGGPAGRGSVAVVASHVIPEYGSATIVVLAASAAAALLVSVAASRRGLPLLHGLTWVRNLP